MSVATIDNIGGGGNAQVPYLYDFAVSSSGTSLTVGANKDDYICVAINNASDNVSITNAEIVQDKTILAGRNQALWVFRSTADGSHTITRSINNWLTLAVVISLVDA